MAQAKKRSPMKVASEAIRVRANGLRMELDQWPGVTTKRAFGMVMVYRGDVVFAALPDSRSIHSEDGIMLKFAEEKPALMKRMAAEARFAPGPMGSGGKSKGEGRKWRIFLIREDSEVHAAIEWLAEAYQLARGRKS
jgi:hypothetical protein